MDLEAEIAALTFGCLNHDLRLAKACKDNAKALIAKWIKLKNCQDEIFLTAKMTRSADPVFAILVIAVGGFHYCRNYTNTVQHGDPELLQ